MITALVAFGFAAACLAIGRWGRRNAFDLVPPSLSPAGRAKQERSLRRGAWSMTIFGGMFVILGLIVGVTAVIGTGG